MRFGRDMEIFADFVICLLCKRDMPCGRDMESLAGFGICLLCKRDMRLDVPNRLGERFFVGDGALDVPFSHTRGIFSVEVKQAFPLRGRC